MLCHLLYIHPGIWFNISGCLDALYFERNKQLPEFPGFIYQVYALIITIFDFVGRIHLFVFII